MEPTVVRTDPAPLPPSLISLIALKASGCEGDYHESPVPILVSDSFLGLVPQSNVERKAFKQQKDRHQGRTAARLVTDVGLLSDSAMSALPV